MTGSEVKILNWYAQKNGLTSWDTMIKLYCEGCLTDARNLALHTINNDLSNDEIITKLS